MIARSGLSALLALGLNANRWKILPPSRWRWCWCGPIRPTTAGWNRAQLLRVHKIVVTPHGQYHVLMHGTTIHGAQKFQNDDGTPVTGAPSRSPINHEDGGIGQAIGGPRAQGAGLRVAVIGSVRARWLAPPSRARPGNLRDRPDHGRYRAHPNIHLYSELRAGPEAGDRRRAADLRRSRTASTT